MSVCAPDFDAVVLSVVAQLTEAHQREVDSLKRELTTLRINGPSGSLQQLVPPEGKPHPLTGYESCQPPPIPPCVVPTPLVDTDSRIVPGPAVPCSDALELQPPFGAPSAVQGEPAMITLSSCHSSLDGSAPALKQAGASRLRAHSTGSSAWGETQGSRTVVPRSVLVSCRGSGSALSEFNGVIASPSIPFSETDSKNTVLWQWKHREGWRDYDAGSSVKIERAYQRGDSKARLKAGKKGRNPMEIFFVDMIQYDASSQNKRDVRRTGPDPWLQRAMRNARQYLRSWETGRPRLESFQQYQDRAACARKSIVQRDEDDAARSLQKFNSSCFARLARSKFFTTTATALVILNAIWIAIELDNNDEPVLIDADVGFQIVENGFCFLFSSEILVRFAAYRRKAMCLTDAWFRFDLVLVLMMVFETWLVPLWLLLASESGTEFFTAGKLQVLRIARLLRLTRMTRLFEALPEMITMVKGITFAIRPVSITLFLLLMLLYVFAIVFRNQVEPGSDLEKDHFPSVTSSMWTLLMHGTLLDNVSILANRIKKDGDPLLTWAFLASIFCTNFTVLNMLIGIVCEMVSVVKQAEDERMAKNKLTSLLQDIMAVYDSDNSGSLKRCEWELFMKNADVCHVLSQYQVDVKGLQNLTDVLFLDGEEEDNSVSLGFDKILDLVIRMKGVNTATVEDVVQLRQYTKHRLDVLEHHLERGQERMEQHILRDQRDLLSERRSTTNSDSQLM